MHPYSTDTSERPVVLFVLAIMGIVAVWLLSYGLRTAHIGLPWWLPAPSVLGLYGLLYATFDRWGWRLPLLRKSGLVKVPDLNGIWTGFITSSFDVHSTKVAATVVIHQTWTHISLILSTETSESQSSMAALVTHNPRGATLTYEFLNEPKADSVQSMQMHRGVAHLTLTLGVNTQVIEGDYYTGRGRTTVGTLHFEKR